jgi:hypothetical protein
MSEVLVGIVLNGLQHIITIAVGLMAVYLGYRLFLELPRRREGESKLDLPGGVSIMLSRIGPGIFFALFGAGMIIYSVTKPIEITDIAEQVATAEGGTTSKRSRTLSGLGQQDGTNALPAAVATIDRSSLMIRLNKMEAEAVESKNGSDLLDTTIAIREAKLALMREAWDPQWGDYDRFHRWVTEQFEQDPPPEGLEDVASYFRQGR